MPNKVRNIKTKEVFWIKRTDKKKLGTPEKIEVFPTRNGAVREEERTGCVKSKYNDIMIYECARKSTRKPPRKFIGTYLKRIKKKNKEKKK